MTAMNCIHCSKPLHPDGYCSPWGADVAVLHEPDGPIAKWKHDKGVLMTERYAIPTADLVDRLGTAKARLAPLLEEIKLMEEEVKARGLGRHEGALYAATVSAGERTTLDLEAVREKLGNKWCIKHSSVTGYIRLNVRVKQTALLKLAAE